MSTPRYGGTHAERIRNFDTVKRGECRDCGNAWWFSMPDCYVCTTCAKTLGRSTSDTYIPKEPMRSESGK